MNITMRVFDSSFLVVKYSSTVCYILIHRVYFAMLFLPCCFVGTARGTSVVALNYVPTPEIPALQYFESVTPGGAADKAGLKTGDYLIEVFTRVFKV